MASPISRLHKVRLQDAKKIYERSLQIALAQEGESIRGTTDLYWGLAMLHHEQGDGESARRYLSKSEELGEQMALPELAVPKKACASPN